MAPRKRTRTKAAQGASVSFMRDIVNKMNLVQKSQIGKINKLMINAGYRSKDAIFVFTFFQLICPIIALAIAFAVTKIDLSAPFATKWKAFSVVSMAYFGFKLPSIMVINSRTKRHYAIQKSLSDTLDLMMICAEAGLSLAASLDRVARELGGTYPEMAEELSLTSIEMGFLPDRKRALINLAERVDMPEVRGITGVLIQTEKYGTPIAQALRVLASEFREQRMLRAEQKAARLPAIMTVPMIIFILPTLFVVVLTPAIIKLSENW
jgi:tight adherence protein C